MNQRVIGIDYGERRIGIAMSDPTALIASPHATLPRRRGKRPPVAGILDIIRNHEATHIVVGLPLTLAGDDSEWTREVREFAATLGARAGLPVTLVDERFSSVTAERAVRGSGLKKADREDKGRIDAAAAALILQNFLDARRRGAHEHATDENA